VVPDGAPQPPDSLLSILVRSDRRSHHTRASTSWRSARWLVLLVVGLAPAAGAQAGAAPQPREPVEVARAFFDDVAAERWRAAASHLDLAPFEVFLREQVEWAREQPDQRGPTVEDLMRHDSTMPRAAAEYQVRQTEKAREGLGGWLEHEFAGISSPDSLAALSTTDAAARWLEAQDPRYRMRRALAAGGCPVPPELAAGPWYTTPRVVLGAVVRDTLAYVLHRPPRHPRAATSRPVDSLAPTRGGEPRGYQEWYADPPAVLTLRRRSGQWRVLGGSGILTGIQAYATVISDCGPRHER
jgi:hypothetical protein